MALRVGDQAGGHRTPLIALGLLLTRVDPTLSVPVSLSPLQAWPSSDVVLSLPLYLSGNFDMDEATMESPLLGGLVAWIRLLWQNLLDRDENGGLARLLLARSRNASER